MDKANIIISIIIVLCIAAAVTAYGLTNSNNPIFSDLSSMGSNDDTGDGLGNNTTITNESIVSTEPSNSGSSSSGGTGSGSSSSSSGSSSGNGGSSSSGSGSSSKHSTTHTTLSYSDAKSIANGAVGEPGCYAGSGYYSGGYWYFKIYDANGNVVDGIAVNDATGHTDRA